MSDPLEDRTEQDWAPVLLPGGNRHPTGVGDAQTRHLWEELTALKAENERLRPAAQAWTRMVEVIGTLSQVDPEPVLEVLLGKIDENKRLKAELAAARDAVPDLAERVHRRALERERLRKVLVDG